MLLEHKRLHPVPHLGNDRPHRETHPLSSAFLLVDGHNLLHRAAFGFPARITSRSGRDITLVFGFFALLRSATRSFADPPQLVVVFDGQDGAGDRRAIEPSYKPPVDGDEAVFGDLASVVEGLGLLGIPCLEERDYEADDVIATLVGCAGDQPCAVMSTDHDFYQLLSDRISLINTARRADRRQIRPADVHGRYGVHPHQWCDYRALTGDPSDNIPGVRGIGPKRARRLLSEGALLEDLEPLGRLTGTVGELVRAAWDEAVRWRELTRLRTDVPQTLPTSPGVLPPAPEVVGQLGLWK